MPRTGRPVTHGHFSKVRMSPTYISYTQAKQRATNPKHRHWSHYGGRGIEFRFKSFEDFLGAIGPRPAGRTLDRIDVDGHYEPGNVRWATNLEQRHNRRDSH